MLQHLITFLAGRFSLERFVGAFDMHGFFRKKLWRMKKRAKRTVELDLFTASDPFAVCAVRKGDSLTRQSVGCHW